MRVARLTFALVLVACMAGLAMAQDNNSIRVADAVADADRAASA